MNDFWQKIVLLIIGWLFGLLGPAVVDLIRTRRHITSLKAALITELQELEIRLAESAFYLAERTGKLDRTFLRWLLAAYERYRGAYVDDEMPALVRKLIEQQEGELRSAAQRRAAARTGQGVMLRKYPVPVLEAILPYLPYISVRVQQELLELKTTLAILEQIDVDARYQYTLTFNKEVMTTMPDLIRQNMEAMYLSALNMTRKAADSAEKAARLIAGGAD